MVEYSNPQPPEHINVTPEHPLKEFTQLIAGIGTLFVIGILVLSFGIGFIARLVPFDLETAIAGRYANTLAPDSETSRYLQQLANRLARAGDLPADMPVTVHFLDHSTVNAMATVGGHILVYRGLLERLEHENGLAMVLAHEIAHVQNRDPIVSLGRGVVLSLALTAVVGGSGRDIAGKALGNAGLLTLLSFSRVQERRADRAALTMVAATYGHVGGADAFLRALMEGPGRWLESLQPEFLSSHPLTSGRVEELREFAAARGWPSDGALTPLPKNLRADADPDAEMAKHNRPNDVEETRHGNNGAQARALPHSARLETAP